MRHGSDERAEYTEANREIVCVDKVWVCVFVCVDKGYRCHESCLVWEEGVGGSVRGGRV